MQLEKELAAAQNKAKGQRDAVGKLFFKTNGPLAVCTDAFAAWKEAVDILKREALQQKSRLSVSCGPS